MLFHQTDTYAIYFGTAHDQLYPQVYLQSPAATSLLERNPYNVLRTSLAIEQLYFLRQIHSTIGYVVDSNPIAPSFAHAGDYLITHQKKTGLGIMAADCLPIIIVDESKPALAIIHAGWRGSLNSILLHTIKSMASTAQEITILFGPAARSCCYEVDVSFPEKVPVACHEKVFRRHESQLFFDVSGYNRWLLQQAGIVPKQIIMDYHFCTMCDHRFFSHRRQAGNAGRQMTVATLL